MTTTDDTHESVGPAADDPIRNEAVLTSDPRAGMVMQTIAVIGVVVAVVAGIVGWRFLTTLDQNLEQSLVIGEDAAATLVDTIDVADQVITDLDAGLDTLDRTLSTVSSTTEETGGVADAAAEIAARLPDGFDDVDAALGTVESLSGTIDGALRAASRIPLGPDYDPATPLPDAIADVRAAFGPIGDDLGELSERLDGFASGTGDLTDDLADVRADLDRTRSSLDASDALLERYRTSAEEAEQLAREGRDDFGTALTAAKIVIVLLAAFAALAQYLPWYLGRRLRGPRPA